MKTFLPKVMRTFSYVIILIFLLSLFGAALRHIDQGGKKLGPLTKPISALAGFPKLAIRALGSSELTGVPPTFIDLDTSFKELNSLNTDLFMLNAFYKKEDGGAWNIRLQNLRDDSVHHQWNITPEMVGLDGNIRKFAYVSPRSSILLPNRGLIAYCDESKNLFRLDENSKVLWRNEDYQFHHTLNLDHEGHVWICASEPNVVRTGPSGEKHVFRDDFITQVDANTGHVLFHKSVSELLVENGYSHLVFGMGNQLVAGSDPIHLNDIQPALYDSPYWQKGDLFLSLRHKSCIVLYRPQTNAVLRVIQGGFLNQHDVDILDSARIGVFNNNYTTLGNGNAANFNLKAELAGDGFSMTHSSIVVYDFRTDSTYAIRETPFISQNIYTKTEGLFEQLSHGLTFVESQNEGRIFVFDHDKILLKKVFHTAYNNKIELPNWIRIYEDIDF